MRPLVLNTRAKSQAGEFTALLKEAGFDVLEIPALEITSLESAERIVETLHSFEPDDFIVFTSANAVVLISKEPQIVQILNGFRVAAVGSKTASILKQSGVPVYLQSSKANSEDLAERIILEKPKRVLYLSGLPNTGVLRDKLAGVSDFTEIPVYTSCKSLALKGELIAHSAELEKVNFLTFLSKEALSAFDDSSETVRQCFKSKQCVVISEKVADAARLLGYKNVTVSQARSVEEIVSILVSLSPGVG